MHCYIVRHSTWIAWLGLLLLGAGALVFTGNQHVKVPHTIRSAYVICMDDCTRLVNSVRENWFVPQVVTWEANRGEGYESDLPLYTRHVMDTGRHDHMQIPNKAALGCLLSHAEIWEDVLRNGSFDHDDDNTFTLVLEQDAIITRENLGALSELWADVANESWSILMLESGHLNTEGTWANVGTRAATCQTPGLCTWLGTRGYVLTANGAATLLDNLHPITVQVDALIGLLAAYDPAFRMFWARNSVVGQNYSGGVFFPRSHIFDGCVKCYMPTGWVAYAVGVALWMGVAIVLVVVSVKK